MSLAAHCVPGLQQPPGACLCQCHGPQLHQHTVSVRPHGSHERLACRAPLIIASHGAAGLPLYRFHQRIRTQVRVRASGLLLLSTLFAYMPSSACAAAQAGRDRAPAMHVSSERAAPRTGHGAPPAPASRAPPIRAALLQLDTALPGQPDLTANKGPRPCDARVWSDGHRPTLTLAMGRDPGRAWVMPGCAPRAACTVTSAIICAVCAARRASVVLRIFSANGAGTAGAVARYTMPQAPWPSTLWMWMSACARPARRVTPGAPCWSGEYVPSVTRCTYRVGLI